MLAGDMGLPEWLVNIRHEATHYTLPSMDLLRNGVSVALEWLKVRMACRFSACFSELEKLPVE